MMPFKVLRTISILTIIGLLLLDYLIQIHWVWYGIVILIFITFLIVGSASMRFNFFVPAFTSPKEKDYKIAITFDDGPTTFTKSILDQLRAYNAKASFFVIGKNVEKASDIAKSIHIEGHTLGNHSYTHHNLFSFFRKKRIIAEIERTNDLIANITGEVTNYFRPPYGVTNPAIAAAVSAKGMKVIGWNLRSFDTVYADPQKVIDRVLPRIKPGSVILLHDNRKETLKILEAILLFAKEKDYKCVTVEEIFKLGTS